MEYHLTFMLSAYQALPDKTTQYAQSLNLLTREREEEMRVLLKRMTLGMCRRECWPLTRLDEELSDLDKLSIWDLEDRYKATQKRYSAVSLLAV